MRKNLTKIKSILGRLLGAYLCILAPPLVVALVRLPHHLDRADWLTEFLYITTLWGWTELILGGHNLFVEALAASGSYRTLLILIVYGTLACFLAALALWFKKPWRWRSAATLIAMSFMMHWVHWGGLGMGPAAVPFVLPLIYLFCFLGARLLRMEQHTPALSTSK